MRDRIQIMKHFFTLIAATGLAAFLLAPSDVLAQSIRAPHVLEHEGKRFVAYVNEKSGTATWIVDTDSLDFNLGTSRSYLSKESVITAANAFVDAHKNVFGIDRNKLAGPEVETDDTFWFISYTQVHNNMHVIGSELGITITYTGKIVAAGARAFPNSSVPFGDHIRSGGARRALPRPGVVVRERYVILPEEQADRYTFREAWEVVLKNREHEPLFHTTYLIDNNTNAVIAEHDNIKTSSSHGPAQVRLVREQGSGHASSASQAASYLPAVPYALSPSVANLFGDKSTEPMHREHVSSGSGSLSGKVTLNYYESPDEDYTKAFVRHYNKPFPHAKVTVQNDATQEIRTKYADESGYYSFKNLADTTHTVTFEIANNKAYANSLYIFEKDNYDNLIRVIKRPFSCEEKEKSFSVEIDGDVKLNYNWGWGSSGDGGVTAHALNSVYHIRAMYDYFNKTYGYEGVDNNIYEINIHNPKYQNEYKKDNNDGYRNDGAIYLLSKRIYLGGPNAMSNEVIFHELTHDIIYTLHKNRARGLDSLGYYDAMEEGFSDYFSADKTNDYIYAGPSGGEIDNPNNPVNKDTLEYVQKIGTSTIRFLFNYCTMDNYYLPNLKKCKDASSLPHVRGLIISGAIWKIRIDTEKPRRAGAKASHLLFDALRIKPTAVTFEQLRDNYTAAAKADQETNNSIYITAIENRFAERRIDGPTIPGIIDIEINTKTKNPVLSWKDNSLIEDGYWVERRYNDGPWSSVDTLTVNAETYIDTSYKCIANKSNKNTYSYRVVPYKDFVPVGNTPGIGIVRSESAVSTVSLSNCRTQSTIRPRVADASVAVAMTDGVHIQPLQSQKSKVPTGLKAPHPNPFNPITTIRYGLAEEGPVRLLVYDLLGREVALLTDGLQKSGHHTVRFKASHLSSGLYFVVLDAGGKRFTKSVLLMK